MIQLVPRVCEGLTDQANCARVVEICGADANADFCAAKLVGKTIGNAIMDQSPMTVAKSLLRFNEDVYHKVYGAGHDYLHHFAKDLIQNVSGNGTVGEVGKFLISVLGAQ